MIGTSSTTSGPNSASRSISRGVTSVTPCAISILRTLSLIAASKSDTLLYVTVISVFSENRPTSLILPSISVALISMRGSPHDAKSSNLLVTTNLSCAASATYSLSYSRNILLIRSATGRLYNVGGLARCCVDELGCVVVCILRGLPRPRFSVGGWASAFIACSY